MTSDTLIVPIQPVEPVVEPEKKLNESEA